MDKNRFYLIVLGGIVVVMFLFFQFYKIKQQTIDSYQQVTTLSQKIKQITYLQKIYKKSPQEVLKKLKFCKITDDTNYQVLCENLDRIKFREVSDLIFNSNLNILKFKIQKNKKLATIYVEIAQ